MNRLIEPASTKPRVACGYAAGHSRLVREGRAEERIDPRSERVISGTQTTHSDWLDGPIVARNLASAY
jgi:hypothetical protein